MFVVVGFIGLILLGGIGFVFGSSLEDQDTFCISCHTTPETAYFDRSTAAISSRPDINTKATDLASMHYVQAREKNQQFACISCHRGDGSLSQRISTLVLGGRNLIIYATGKADPALEKTDVTEAWLPNAACANCHKDILLTDNGFENHFHNNLPQALAVFKQGGQIITAGESSWSQEQLQSRVLHTVENTPVTCIDCHPVHKTISNGVKTQFVQLNGIETTCNACHQVTERGPRLPVAFRQ